MQTLAILDVLCISSDNIWDPFAELARKQTLFFTLNNFWIFKNIHAKLQWLFSLMTKYFDNNFAHVVKTSDTFPFDTWNQEAIS